MSTLQNEAPQINPLESEQGLSESEISESKGIIKNIEGAKAYSRALESRRYQDYHRTIGREINEMLEERGARREIKKLGKVARNHYKDNESKYQVQAVKDAAAEGVHTDFGA